jgi:hypothetical protein
MSLRALSPAVLQAKGGCGQSPEGMQWSTPSWVSINLCLLPFEDAVRLLSSVLQQTLSFIGEISLNMCMWDRHECLIFIPNVTSATTSK